MRRSLVITSVVCVLSLAPALLAAQTPPVQPQPQTPTQAPAAQAQAPAAPKVSFTTPSGLLLVPIKPDQTAVFEEMAAKILAGLAKTPDAALKQQAAGFKVYKSSEPFGPNALYVVFVDPAVANSEYDLFQLLHKTSTPEEQRAPEFTKNWERYVAAFASGLSRLSLTPLAAK